MKQKTLSKFLRAQNIWYYADQRNGYIRTKLTCKFNQLLFKKLKKLLANKEDVAVSAEVRMAPLRGSRTYIIIRSRVRPTKIEL